MNPSIILFGFKIYPLKLTESEQLFGNEDRLLEIQVVADEVKEGFEVGIAGVLG
jgi:hypothetical protein